MRQIDRKEVCCGCGACTLVCPKSCISMREDNEGFLYPYVDKQGCIHCELCNKTCPVLNYKEEELGKPKTYVAYCKDVGLRISSSSGGIFSLLAGGVLDRGGIVFGAAFDKAMMVHHIGINDKGDMAKLRGSKYIQSRIERTYIETFNALKDQRIVLFSGTACQIAGLKKYLDKEYENLITVDVLCHGTPTPKLWKKYVVGQELKAGACIREVSFRNKQSGWKDYTVKIVFENKYEYKVLAYKDPYMRLFLSDICLRPSCYDCKFKGINRPSDITLGDCWGIENYIPEMDDNKGTSVVLLHTLKGKMLLDSIDTSLCKREAELDRALSPNADSRKSVKKHPKRGEFFSKIDNVSIEELTKLVIPTFRKRLLISIRKFTLYHYIANKIRG